MPLAALENAFSSANCDVLNIAEGFESQSNKTFIRYLYQAKASAGEVRSQLYVALDQGYVTAAQFEQLYQKALSASRLIAGFIAYLESLED